MTVERLRVLLFVTSFHVGGTERHVLLSVRGLDGTRFDLRLACLKRTGELLGDIEDTGLPLREFPIRSLYGWHSIWERIRFARYLRHEAIDVVHSYGFYANLFAIPAARLARVPAVIASIRDMGDLLWTGRQRRAERIACRLADRVLVNAGAVARRLAGEGYDERKIEVIPNGVDTALFSQASQDPTIRQELGLAPGAPVVVMVARMNQVRGVEIKGTSHFLDAAAAIAQRHDGVRFVLVGDGPCRAELESRSRALGLASRMLFTGFRHDVPRVLSCATVFVHPSLTEAHSNSLLEAMAAGLPIVATRVGGIPETVLHGRDALLVPPADPQALTEAVCGLLENPGLRARLGRSAQDRAKREYSLEHMVASTMRCYEESSARRGRSPLLRTAASES